MARFLLHVNYTVEGAKGLLKEGCPHPAQSTPAILLRRTHIVAARLRAALRSRRRQQQLLVRPRAQAKCRAWQHCTRKMTAPTTGHLR